MANLEENIDRLQKGKEAIKNELKNKGYTDGSVIDGVSLSAAKINQIAPFIANMSTSSGVSSVNTLQGDITIEGNGLSSVTTDLENKKITIATTLTADNVSNALGFIPISSSSIGNGLIQVFQNNSYKGSFYLNSNSSTSIYLDGENPEEKTTFGANFITDFSTTNNYSFSTETQLKSYAEITGLTFDGEIYNAGNEILHSYHEQIPLNSIIRRLSLSGTCEYMLMNEFMTIKISYGGSNYTNGTDNISFNLEISFSSMHPSDYYGMSLILGFTYKGLSYAPANSY